MIGKNTVITKVVRDIESGKMLSRRLRWTDEPFARAMGVRFPSSAVSGIGGGLPGSAAETVLYTVGPLELPIDNAQVLLIWSYTLQAGTGTTAVQFRIRRGSTVTGTALDVNPNSVPLAAGVNGRFSGCYQDTPGIVANLQYSLTIVQTGATAAGINADGCLMAMVL